MSEYQLDRETSQSITTVLSKGNISDFDIHLGRVMGRVYWWGTIEHKSSGMEIKKRFESDTFEGVVRMMANYSETTIMMEHITPKQ